ncbi:hypothetical protein BH10ACI2_BH10ACI2_24570 [soil metagenome]
MSGKLSFADRECDMSVRHDESDRKTNKLKFVGHYGN